MTHRARAAVGLLTATLLPWTTAFADELETSQPAAKAPRTAPAKPPMPSAAQLVILVRTSLLTLNDALKTGNFTVLRDVGSPGFKERNTAAALGNGFAPFSASGVDLSAVAVIAPTLADAPTIDGNNRIQIKGTFPGDPIAIDFELAFVVAENKWKLDEIAVEARRGEPEQ